MSSQLLQSELLNLIQESKRKNTDLRNSLSDLRALPSTSEAQITADLVRKPKFADPFILACHSRHAKLAGIGVVCLQRIVASGALPPDRLKDALGGLRETVHLGLDVQLKILQSLPSLLQNYSNTLTGELLGTTIEICATLQGSKTIAVSSTATATLQQLMVSIFERVSTEDKTKSPSDSTTMLSIDGQPVKVGNFAYDALLVLDDLCRLVEGEQLQFLRLKSLAPSFVLELIENILINSDQLFSHHPELTQVLRIRLMPLTVRYFSERHGFSQTVRIARVLLVLLKRHMSLLVEECEMALGLLTHSLEPDGNAPWRRVLCMEIFRGLYAEPGLVRLIYSLYDADEGRKNILKDHMASFVRLASEKPALIGLSNQSTMPSSARHLRSATEEQITLEAGGVAGVIGTTVSSDTNVSGISSQWSTVRTPYIDLLDKSDAPSPPDTYVYSIIITCISTFSEGLAKFILPLTVPDLKQKRKARIATSDQEPDSPIGPGELRRTDSLSRSETSASRKFSIPINPLELEGHAQLPAIKICAGIIETCWPAILATCSTFLYASLDDDFYHNLVRSFQKLAHVAGLLRLSVPRDAFLTTLGKAAIPTDTTNVKVTSSPSSTSLSEAQPNESAEKRKGSRISAKLVTIDTSSLSPESSSGSLNTRNLLCLRALLNLGIALGPTLDQSAWSIILAALRDTDLVIGASSLIASKASTGTTNVGDAGTTSVVDVLKVNLGTEIIAVQSASLKLFQSTSEYASEPFQNILVALLNLADSTQDTAEDDTTDDISGIPGSPQSAKRLGKLHQNYHRVSLTMGRTRMLDEELKFVLDRTSEIARANLERLSSTDEGDRKAWDILAQRLISTTKNKNVSLNLCLKANGVLTDLVFRTMGSPKSNTISVGNGVQRRNLETLKAQIESIYDSELDLSGPQSIALGEIHEQCLEVLKNILEQYAESFDEEWHLVFHLISTVFGKPANTESNQQRKMSATQFSVSPRLMRAAYQSLQLVASDFLALLPPSCLLSLVDSFSSFASQQQDFNISLTTTSFFWNVSDFLQGQIERFSIEDNVDTLVSEKTLADLSRDSDASVSRNSLWLLMLLRIVDITTDERPEIRNSAVRTLLRIFDAYGQQLSPKAWRLCLNRVLFRMVGEIEAKLLEGTSDQEADESGSFKAWIDTTVVTIKGLSDLITNFFEPIVQDEEFDESWERLLRYLRDLNKLGSLKLCEAAFSSLSDILLQVQGTFSKRALSLTWSLWLAGHPSRTEDLLNIDISNQDAALAYLTAFGQIYRLYKDEITKHDVSQILEHLQLLVWNSVSPRYSPDTDRSSKLQALVISCIKTLCQDKDSSQSEIILCLAEFVDSALSRWSPNTDSRRPTFVAFSKDAIDLLNWYIQDFGIKKDIFTNGSVTTALEHLASPVKEKYEWQGKDREPQIWKTSTTASLNILKVVVPYVETHYSESNQSEITRFWKCVVDIARGIVSAKGYEARNLPFSKILADESFDIDAFTKLKTVIIPSLGASMIPDGIRRDFACALLYQSFLYAPLRGDLPTGQIEQNPLHGLYDVRSGRTFDPAPTQRSRMAYLLIDTFCELASISHESHPKSPKRTAESKESSSCAYTSIARSISPYLILRCAVSLRSYIADQPLRGLMPQPTPSRKALLHLLQRMVELRTDPAAVPELPSSVSTFKFAGNEDDQIKHIEWMYPLVVKAVQVAGREKDDGQVLQALGKLLLEMGRSHV
ncbi:hypothetical protein ASPZODRAFT_1468357 [Penicilliopsis zonata CBS 506.65]|uniref:Endosomal peripheral membrane protein n=1 Tax=Penicilliopsis zonata CBS 506.65 TaxID=1073090 RepID=A0A1L9SQI3_9EURO|nr:hypothetical protein ASPZODRAFT_1468357 [Penicilliopsis zonata CBS 506.65]OJJ49386.1 hypothetical protein ASPZODRAFT_1468357 [Penicilliopsis zonata CBS 506.65]